MHSLVLLALYFVIGLAFAILAPRRFPAFFARHRRIIFSLGCALFVLSACAFMMGCAVPSMLQDIEAFVPIASGAITGILGIIAGFDPALAPIAAEITAITTIADNELANVNTMIGEYKKNPSDTILDEIEQSLSIVSTNLSKLLTTAGLPAAAATKIQAVVQAVLTEVEALISSIQIFHSSTAGTTITLTKLSSSQAFKATVKAALATPAAK